MSKSNLPWPKMGDKLFVPEYLDQSNAFLGAYTHHGLSNAIAFKDAADIVIESLEQSHCSPYRDDLLHPLAYLYRHALELKLKEIIDYGLVMGCYKRSVVQDILNGHNLARLWNKAKMAIVDRWPDGDKGELKAVDAIINEMHRSDDDGQKWRYRREKNGRPIQHEELPQFVSLKSLREVMDAAFTFLDACKDGIDDGIQAMKDGMF